jgi:hypothetical protein
VYPGCFAKDHGPLYPVVERVLRGFLAFGVVEHGFARLWCATCRASVRCHSLAAGGASARHVKRGSSCSGRSGCAKRRELLPDLRPNNPYVTAQLAAARVR